jgi:hypothetical protein
MPKVKKEFIRVGHESEPDFIKWRFEIEISVNAKGLFYSYMPPGIIDRMQYGNVKFDPSLTSGRHGCFSASTIEGVVSKAKSACKEASSREQVSEVVVIKYAIKTSCAYCINEDSEVVPNGTRAWVGSSNYQWINGTVSQHATKPEPFGFQMYAKPFYKRTYLYCNGRESIEYAPIFDRVDNKERYYLAWLSAVCSVGVPDETTVQEVEYTEDIARFFVETYKSMCELNERIKGFLDPAGIRRIAESKLKMLNY